MKDVKIIKFSSKQEYQLWLDEQSYSVQKKAFKFKEKFGDVIPIVVVLCEDTCATCGGCDAVTHLFVHPDKLQEILGNTVLSGRRENESNIV